MSQGTPLRIPPQNLDAEKALLGSVLLRPEAMYDVMDLVKKDIFYAERHAMIWETMMDLFQKRTPIDLVSLTSRLTESGIIENVGGASYIASLAGLVPSSAHIHHYAELVHKKYMMRRLIAASEEMSRMGFDESGDLDETMDKAEKAIYDLTNAGTTHKFIEMKDTLHEAWERLDHLHHTQDELRGVPSGFKALDDKLSGFQKSDLIILAARPSVGKTSLALDIVRNAAMQHKVPTCIFSLEMSAQQLVDRMLAAESRVDSWKIRTGRGLSLDTDFNYIRDAMGRLQSAPIYIDDQPGNNILKMRSVARRLKNEKGLGLIVVDYLQLMVPTQSKNSDNVVQQVTEISRSLKNLARELEVPVIALSQLSRAVEARGGKPRLSDLRDSGSIEQDADVVMFIHREDRVNKDTARPNIAEILIEKHRNGPTGVAELFFDGNHTSFMNLEKSEFTDVRSEVTNF